MLIMILPCGVLIMNSKVLKVFYGVDNLPYKDKERVVYFPVVGGTFMGASNTTEIWFYFEKIGEPNNTWVAIAKLPNGKRGAVKLDTFNDDELNEPYAKLQLNTWFTQMRGDVYISLNGYDGGITLSLDQETGLYEVTGTPVIQATGSVKLTIQYATQLIGGDEIDEITLQEIYAMSGEKLDTDKGIVVIANPQVYIAQYDNGQYFYSKSDNSIYEKVINEAEPIPVLTLRFTAYSKSETLALVNGVLSQLNSHVNNKNNPHEVTKAQVGLGNVDNTKQYPYTSGVNLENTKADKADTYTKEEISNIIDTLKSGEQIIINTSEYPTLEDFLQNYPDKEEGHIYLYPIDTSDNTKGYYRYIWEKVNNTYQWINLGDTDIDLSNYYTKEEIATLLANYLPLSGGTITGDISPFGGAVFGTLGNVTPFSRIYTQELFDNHRKNLISYHTTTLRNIIYVGNPDNELFLFTRNNTDRVKVAKSSSPINDGGPYEEIAYLSDIPSLAGYATEQWVQSRGYSTFSGSYNDLTSKPDLSIYALNSSLSIVATSGSYNDLINKPTIPEVEAITNAEIDEILALL